MTRHHGFFALFLVFFLLLHQKPTHNLVPALVVNTDIYISLFLLSSSL